MIELNMKRRLIQVYFQERASLEGAKKGSVVQYKPV